MDTEKVSLSRIYPTLQCTIRLMFLDYKGVKFKNVSSDPVVISHGVSVIGTVMLIQNTTPFIIYKKIENDVYILSRCNKKHVFQSRVPCKMGLLHQ